MAWGNLSCASSNHSKLIKSDTSDTSQNFLWSYGWHIHLRDFDRDKWQSAPSRSKTAVPTTFWVHCCVTCHTRKKESKEVPPLSQSREAKRLCIWICLCLQYYTISYLCHFSDPGSIQAQRYPCKSCPGVCPKGGSFSGGLRPRHAGRSSVGIFYIARPKSIQLPWQNTAACVCEKRRQKPRLVSHLFSPGFFLNLLMSAWCE